MCAIMVSTSRQVSERRSSSITDKRGEAVGLRVERAMGTQGRPPPLGQKAKGHFLDVSESGKVEGPLKIVPFTFT